MKFKTRDGTHLFYEDTGTGKPLVLIHGWPLSSAMWEYQLNELPERGIRCIAYDRRGFGKYPSTTAALLSFEDYIAYDDGTENRYELVDGELVATSPPTFRHMLIAKFIEQCLDAEITRLGLGWFCFREAGVRTGVRKSRLTDVYVLTPEQVSELVNRAAIAQTPPLLAVEVVSPDSITRDYRYKRTEYAALEIPEYWIVDPLELKVTVLTFNEGLYDEAVFFGDQLLVSPTFPELSLSVEQILAAGNLP